jgi:Domain of unknown function (DUF5076)
MFGQQRDAGVCVVEHELMRPPDADTARQAVEVLRGWVIDGHPQYSLFPTLWKDDLPSWGRFLADTANHLANAIAEATGRDRQQILAAIVSAFAQELAEGTRTHEGQFQEGPAEPGAAADRGGTKPKKGTRSPRRRGG